VEHVKIHRIERMFGRWHLHDALGTALGSVIATCRHSAISSSDRAWFDLPGWDPNRRFELFAYDEEG